MTNICLINASNPINTQIEWDSYVDYRDGLEKCFNGDKIVKMCRSWHSIPAALETEFFVYNKPGWQGVFKYDGVIVLVNRDLQAVFPLIKQLKAAKKKVLVGFHESADDFFQQASPHHNQDHNWMRNFLNLTNEVDGVYNIMISYDNWFEWLLKKPILSCGHAAPFTEWNHGFTVPYEEREGIMVGTRTFNQRLRRNTLQALGIALKVAEKENTFVTWVCEESWCSKADLNRMFGLPIENLNFVKGPLSYEDWLKTIAKHKVLFHYDYSCTLGQLVLDAALVDVMCVGGNSDNNFILGTASSYCSSISEYELWHCEYNDITENLKHFKKMHTYESIKNKIETFFQELNV